VSVPSVEASSSSAETASERLRNLLEVFRLLIELRKKAQERRADKRVYEAYVGQPLSRDPGKQDILLSIDKSESFLPFVFNATIVFAVAVLDDLLESLERFLRENGNKELVVKANAIVRDRSCDESGQGTDRRSTGNPGKFRKQYVFVSLCLGLMDEQEARDALQQRTNEHILDKRFAVLELYQKRCAIVHDDPFADMRSNPVEDYEIVYHVVQRLEEKWNESFAHASAHALTPGQN